MELSNFETIMKKWVQTDTQIRLMNQKMRTMKKEHTMLTKTVCEYIRENKMEHRKIETSDSKIEYYEKCSHPSLTYAFLEKYLADVISDKKSVDYIIDYLKSKREMKKSWDIKRIFKKGMKKGTAKVRESNENDSDADSD
jgi:phage shock protein A